MLIDVADEGTSFFDEWDYFNTYDPTGGWVQYVLTLNCRPWK